MRLRNTWLLFLLACCWPATAPAQLQLMPGTEPQCVFFGDARNIGATFHNPSDQTFTADIRIRLFQASSATTVPLGETAWKKLTVSPGQTVLESAPVNFPAVKTETRFLIRWLADTNTFIGTTDVLAYPSNLLKDLKLLAGEKPVGVFDPQNQLKPVLKTAGVEFENLEDSGVGSFDGKLAIVGPFAARTQMREGLAEQIQTLIKKGAGVVWLQPPAEKRHKLQSSFYSVPFGETAAVIVQPELVSGLAESPQAQLNLIRFCELALHPEPVRLPYLTEQP